MPLLGNDRQLLERFRLGDQQALSVVYNAYAPVVAAFLAKGFTFSSQERKLQFSGYHQPFDLDNALQETFAKAFSHRARLAYDGLTPYRHYLLTIARNVVISEFRRREVAMSQLINVVKKNSQGVRLEDDVDRNPFAPQENTPGDGEGEFLKKELIALYQAFLKELKPAHRAFFEARFEKRLTQIEAGKQVGISHMQARTLEKKLRKQFLKFMQSRGYFEGYSGLPVVVTS